MESKEAIEIDYEIRRREIRGRTRDGNGGTQLVITALAVRNHDVESVGRPALEDRDQNFFAASLLITGERGPFEPQRRCSDAGHRDGRIAKKNSA